MRPRCVASASNGAPRRTPHHSSYLVGCGTGRTSITRSVPPVIQLLFFVSGWCPREESNLYYKIRNLASYPLNDGGASPKRNYCVTGAGRVYHASRQLSRTGLEFMSMSLLAPRSLGTERIDQLPIVFIDIETTGLTRATGGEICEIGAVKIDPKSLAVVSELDVQMQLTNPLKKSEQELSFNGYNGFSFAGWTNAIPARQAVQQLNDFCSGCVPWGWNISFEFYWLSSYYEQYNLEWKGDYHWMCLMSAANFTLRQEFEAGRIPKLSLSQVSTFFGLGEEPNPHRGLTGARYEHAVYRKLRDFSNRP